MHRPTCERHCYPCGADTTASLFREMPHHAGNGEFGQLLSPGELSSIQAT